MGIHLMADGQHRSQGQDWEGFKAGAERACLGLRPAVWRQRKQKSISAVRERCDARVDILSFFLLRALEHVKSQCWVLTVACVPVVVSSSSSSFTSSAGVFVGLGAGCTQVGTWLLLGNSSTRLSGSSSSLYVHANWDRMTLSLVWNTQKEKKTLNPPDMMGMMGISDSGQVAQVFRFQHLPKKKRNSHLNFKE